MMSFFYIGMQYIGALFEIGFLYIWLRIFSARRKLKRGIIAIVVLCSAAARCCTNIMGNAALAVVLEIIFSILTAAILFKGQRSNLFFYTITNYILVIAVECIFSCIVNVKGDLADGVKYLSGAAFILIAKAAVMYTAYFLVKKLFSREIGLTEPRYTWKQYVMFYSIPAASCGFTVWTYMLKDTFDSGIGTKVIFIIAVAIFIMADFAVMYLYETFNAVILKEQALGMVNAALTMKEKHYQTLDDIHEQYDVIMHDMKHKMRAIAALAEEGECGKICSLIDEERANVAKIEQKIICSNKVLNALLLERKAYADDNGVMLETEISEPLCLQGIDEPDIIAIMGNLLDNAIEAQKRSGKQDGIELCMRMSREERHIIISLENSYEESYNAESIGIKISGLIGDKHGIGLRSVSDIVKKYGGIIESKKGEGRYHVKVLLPNQSNLKEQKKQQSCSDNATSYLQMLPK